jgi:hypothetical protein
MGGEFYMKSISKSLVPLATSNVMSAMPVQAKSNLLTLGSFTEALACIKDKLISTGNQQKSIVSFAGEAQWVDWVGA